MPNHDVAARGSESRERGESPTLSVVLPVLNESRDLPRLLDEVVGQQSPPGGFEVLVADGGSTDGTQDIVRSYRGRGPEVRLLDNPRRLSSAGRNVGARAARGRYVMFLDGHCAVPRQDYLVRTVEIFEESQAAALCRPQPLNRLRDGGWAEAISNARHSWLGHASGSDIYGGEPGFTDPRSAGAVYRREVLEELGYYDERFDACEDVEFNHRVHAAGLPAYRHPDLAIHYRPRSAIAPLYRQMFRYGRGRARLMAKHPTVVPLPLVVISLYVLATLVAGGTGLEALAWVGGIPAAAWIALVLLESVRTVGIGMQTLRMAVAFGAIYAGLVFGFWRGLLEYPRYRRAPEEA